MAKPYDVTVEKHNVYKVRVNAIDKTEAFKLGENAVEDGEGEFVETQTVIATDAEEYVPE